MNIRPYNEEQDLADIERFWLDLHWLSTEKDPMLSTFLSSGNVQIAELAGRAEALAMSAEGYFTYLDRHLPMAAIAAVTTSTVARQHKIGLTVTASVLARAQQNGAAISVLHMFDQGYYDQLGFASGSYDHWFEFDPSSLKLKTKAKPATRLQLSDSRAMHRAMLKTPRRHGACVLNSSDILLAELCWLEHGLGLGYFDPSSGELTHFFWGANKGEHGPFEIQFMAYQTTQQLTELFALLKGLSDQFYTVRMREPTHIQIQDLLSRPLKKNQLLGSEGKFKQQCIAESYWQARILNLQECIASTCISKPTIHFNLVLKDGLSAFLATKEARGYENCGGEYRVSIGVNSDIHDIIDPSLPTLHASIGAFTRLWLGVRPATGLVITDELSGPDPLLKQLDDLFCLPTPRPQWEF